MKEQPLKYLETIEREDFQKDLISWFSREQRDLPWRKDRDPYKVWVSEIMLQQTRVDTVIPYFNRFLEKFPTLDALALAEEDEVLKVWEGLGYYSRVRNLQSAVKEVHEQYGGIVPDTPKEISSLKGVGPYTAGAILSIAYGKPEPAVDGNVMRVFSRILSIWLDIAKPSSRKVFEEAVKALISKENPSYFNQALMELGALICTPTSPSCLLCPVREHCRAFDEGVQEELPVKSKKKAARKLNMAAAVIFTDDDRVVIHKRPGTGLLANLWEFPNFEVSTSRSGRKQLEERLEADYKVDASLKAGVITKIQHVFSHIVWDIEIYAGSVESSALNETELIAVTEQELEKYAFPVSHQKIWKETKLIKN
ncbi:A/G-specific adenine glycosylase [[Bacillus] enclensis]|uniref:A/G-specific adenine glycosylase n=1 Tax=[Bacillus] enclensis TaxID=1402860 RepID=UPI0018DD2395|nr:A/G-specific adenine glycosylase [[Bacillus] enclensis]MBH9966857.1 A/G-specific adenine glycosylase [[Bacillus] enclensis]QWC23961.1 A/G-specific adenine glycosylase [Bacillus haikouensis]